MLLKCLSISNYFHVCQNSLCLSCLHCHKSPCLLLPFFFLILLPADKKLNLLSKFILFFYKYIIQGQTVTVVRGLINTDAAGREQGVNIM